MKYRFKWKKYPYDVLDIRLDPAPGINCPVFEDAFYFVVPDGLA
jgi:hypothetical protein